MRPAGNRPFPGSFPFIANEQEASMGKGKMNGDNSADSKQHFDHKARGSGGTTKKNQEPGSQDNNKAQNTKSNQQ